MRTDGWSTVLPAALVLALLAGGASAAEQPVADAIVAEALQGGLSRDEAVSVALAANAGLQAAFDEVGVARADLQQAGLYSNPDLAVLLRWPAAEPGSDVEVELGFNIADLWQVPIRRDVAQARLEQVTMTVAAEVLNVRADARAAWDNAVLAAELVARTDESVAATEAWRDRIYERFEYGFTTDLDQAMADAEVADQQMRARMARALHRVALARLRRVLGIGPDLQLSLAGEPPALPAAVPEVPDLLMAAARRRPDLRAAEHGLIAAARNLRLQRAGRWRHVTLGPAYARESDGGDLWGLTLEAELPVADANQAGRARAQAELSHAGNSLEALRGLVNEEVTVAAEELALALERERILRETVLPTRQRAVDFATTYYNQMQLNMLHYLQAQRELFQARREHLEARAAALRALVELEFAVGGDLPAD